MGIGFSSLTWIYKRIVQPNNCAIVRTGGRPMAYENGETNYAKDGSHVFWEGRIIPEADPPSFQAIDRNFAVDKHNVFYSGDVEEDRDQVLAVETSIQDFISAHPELKDYWWSK